MTMIQTVFAATAAAVAVSVGLIVTGVTLILGPPWAFIAAGVLLAAASVAGAVVLLRDSA